MKLKKIKYLGCFIALFISICSFGLRADPPALSITLTSPSEISLTVTNGATNSVYAIYSAEFLTTNSLSGTNSGWTLLTTGVAGQTNFTVAIDETETGFFRAAVGGDSDSDGIPDFQDARPFDANFGMLTVTIETPANGSTVN